LITKINTAEKLTPGQKMCKACMPIYNVPIYNKKW